MAENGQLTCGQCNQVFVPPAFTSRPIENVRDLVQVGAVCLNCGRFNHGYVENAQVRRYRATMAKRFQDLSRNKTPGNSRAFVKAEEQYKQVFQELQRKWKHVFGIPAAWEKVDADAS